jgi:hypothetical protein
MRRFHFRTVPGHRTWPLPSLTLRPEFGMKMNLYNHQSERSSVASASAQ